jgi:hypothetical protein
MTVPFDENPYSAMAAFFKTDEGVEIYRVYREKNKKHVILIYKAVASVTL